MLLDTVDALPLLFRICGRERFRWTSGLDWRCTCLVDVAEVRRYLQVVNDGLDPFEAHFLARRWYSVWPPYMCSRLPWPDAPPPTPQDVSQTQVFRAFDFVKLSMFVVLQT